MGINRFEDIQIWQKSRELTKEIYYVFRNLKDYSFRDQIQRAAVSVMNNVAEGYERKGDKELCRYLYISKASCGEVRSMLYLALDLKYITGTEFEKLYGESLQISKMISGFIKKLN